MHRSDGAWAGGRDDEADDREDDGLSARLGTVAQGWQARADTASLLAAFVADALELVPGAEGGSVAVATSAGDVSFHHASGDLPARVDAVQEEVEEGPGRDAVLLAALSVRVPDLRQEARWHRFVPRVLGLGARSLLSLRLTATDGGGLGALNLVARRPRAFTEEAERVGLHLAAHAGIAYAHARTVDHLREAVAGRDRIGQAKGLLMGRLLLDADQAFAVLVRASQRSHRPLREVADELVRTRRVEGLDL